MATDAASFATSIHAVVVGVGSYAAPSESQSAALRDLPGCPEGARQLEAALVDIDRCRVPAAQVACLTERVETDKATVISALTEMAGRADARDVLLFYFAGHGLDSADGYYLVMADSNTSSGPAGSISASDIVNCLKGTRARGVLIVLDCCGGAGLVERAPQLLTELGDRFDYRILISSSTTDEKSWELPGEGSPFTAFLIEAISGGLPAMGRKGEIYFRDLYGFLVVEMDKLFKGRLRELVPQRPNVAPFYREEPLLFVNSNASLRSIRLDTARFSPNEVRTRIKVAVAIFVGILATATIAAWTWQDQHIFAQRLLPSGVVDIERGYPGWRLFGYPKPIWQLDLKSDDVDADAALGQTGFLVTEARADPYNELMGQLTTVGRSKLLLQTAQYDRATAAARNALDGIAEPRSEPAFAAYDVLVSAAYAQPDTTILDLLGKDQIVTSRVLQVLGANNIPALEKALGSPELQGMGRIDRDLVFSAFPPACSPALNDYVQRELGDSWTFDQASADMIVRTTCAPSVISGAVDWHRIAADQAHIRILLGQKLEAGSLIKGFSQFIADISAELKAGSGSEPGGGGSDTYFQLSHALDAAVVFDVPGFACAPNLTALLERADAEPSTNVGNDDRARFARYVGKYCFGVAELRQSDDGSPQFRIGGRVLMSVPATELTREDVDKMAAWNAELVERLALTQVGGSSRPNEKLAFVPYVPDSDVGLSIMEQLVSVDDESLQLSALAWVLQHRRNDFIPLARRLLPKLRDEVLLAVATMTKDDDPIERQLASLVVDLPQSEGRRAAWITVFGDGQEAYQVLTSPSLASRTAAFGCLTFRSDLATIRKSLLARGSSVLAGLLIAVDRSEGERARLLDDMAKVPPSQAEWRAHVVWTTSLGGRLLLRSMLSDGTLELR